MNDDSASGPFSLKISVTGGSQPQITASGRQTVSTYGHYAEFSLPGGTYHITVSEPGYEDATEKVGLLANYSTSLELKKID